MARRKTPPSRRERLQAVFGTTHGRLLARATAAALVFLLAGMVMRQARAYTYRLDEFRVHRNAVDFVSLPTWADANVQWALQPRMFHDLSVSIYDPNAESIVRAHAERHPLVRTVESVRVLYPNRAEVRAALRIPVAQVAIWVDAPGRKQVRRWCLLSDDGCLLPRRPYASYLDRLPYKLPVVTGITEPAPRRPGEVWEDRSGRVQEAAAAARLAARMYNDFGGRVSVVRVDVARFPASPSTRPGGEVRFVISCPPRTSDGARVERTVEWGRTDRARHEVAKEDDYHTKFRRLLTLLTKADAPGYLDVRYEHRFPEGTQRTGR